MNREGAMIDYNRSAMCETSIHETRDCVIAVTETRNVTGRLGQAELRALRVLADAGLVPPLARVLTSPTGRNWVFPDMKAS
jgi:hypothetical protein